MKQLRTKVFWAIYGSTTLVVVSAVLIYNFSNYFSTRAMLHDASASPFVDPRYTGFVIEGFLNHLISSLILLALIEVALYFIVKKITNWVVKPAEDSFAKQKDFIADASHELKTPLSVIVASAESMSVSSKNKKHIDNIRTESERMRVLLAKMLTLASTEDKGRLQFIEGNLSKVVELTALAFEAKAIEKNRKLNLNIQDGISSKYQEEDIKQLVEILLDNALEHSFDCSTIVLNLKKDSSKVFLEVTNEGEAIAPGDEEKIFERFYRADKVRNTKENRYGLGLAIAKNIVENHNGKISASSNNGKTTFRVVL